MSLDSSNVCHSVCRSGFVIIFINVSNRILNWVTISLWLSDFSFGSLPSILSDVWSRVLSVILREFQAAEFQTIQSYL